MTSLLLMAFVIAWGATTYSIGAGNVFGAVISGFITAAVIVIGIVTADR